MTNDEAIYTLKNTAFLGWSEQAEKVSEAVRMAVEALKTQLPKEDITSDCISRQAAIRWVKTECNPYGKPTLDFESGKRVMEHLKTMPSAQPERTEERTETHACDCISRRKAFEYFVTLWECIGTIMDRDEWEDVCMTTANEIPSAEPEIIRCKDCKHRDPEDRKCDCGHDILWQLPRQDDWYCADAERRTDG